MDHEVLIPKPLIISHFARRKRDPGKVQMAARLRKETTLSVKQIAVRLHLGTPASASVCLLAAMDKTHATPLTQGRPCI